MIYQIVFVDSQFCEGWTIWNFPINKNINIRGTFLSLNQLRYVESIQNNTQIYNLTFVPQITQFLFGDTIPNKTNLFSGS